MSPDRGRSRGWARTIRNVLILEGLPHVAGALGIATGHLVSLGDSAGQLVVAALCVNAAMWFLLFGPNTERNANYLEDESASITLSSKIAHHLARSRRKSEIERRRWAKRVHRVDLLLWELVYAAEAVGIGASAGWISGLQYWTGAAAFGLLKNVAMLSVFELRERRSAAQRTSVGRQQSSIVTAVDVAAHMPHDWLRQVRDLVASEGRFVTLPGGKISTSLEAPDFTTAYTVVPGGTIERGLPWLWKLYQGLFLDLVRCVAGGQLVTDREADFGININVLTAHTQRDGYELHTDINAWTALLAASTLEEGDGGELVHVLPNGRSVETRLVAGRLYIFDGRNHPHRVLPLRPGGGCTARITIPMDYVYVGWHQARPAEMQAIFDPAGHRGSRDHVPAPPGGVQEECAVP